VAYGRDRVGDAFEEGAARVQASSVPRYLRRQWAELMRRSFGCDLLACVCGGKMTLVALMVDPVGIRRLMRRLTSAAEDHGIAPARASP
jgi:hypothetical protein